MHKFAALINDGERVEDVAAKAGVDAKTLRRRFIDRGWVIDRKTEFLVTTRVLGADGKPVRRLKAGQIR